MKFSPISNLSLVSLIFTPDYEFRVLLFNVAASSDIT